MFVMYAMFDDLDNLLVKMVNVCYFGLVKFGKVKNVL